MSDPQPQKQFTSVSRIVAARALELLGSFHENPVNVLFEYVENGLDAGAKRVWVIINPDEITIIDDGSGMVADLLPDDLGFFSMFLEDLQTGKVRPDFDIREIMTKTSQKSLRWMMECVAYSPKKPSQSDTIRGMRGIGALAFRQIANRAVWTTRPASQLAKEYWPEDKGKARNPPTFELTPPTLDQLRANDTSYDVRELTTQLSDPYGQSLDSGTRIKISELREGMEFSLRPGTLAEYFRIRFGGDIKTRGIRIAIVDKVTEEGKKLAGGREIVIAPSEYKGVLCVEKTLSIAGVPFKTEIYYVRTGKVDHPVMLRRRQTDIRPLADLDEFKKSPWNSPRLTGYVEFPPVPEDIAPWTTDKRMPFESPTRKRWQKAVHETADSDIEATIARIEEQMRESKLQDLAATLAQSTMEAIQRVDATRDIIIGGVSAQKRTRKPGKRVKTPKTSTLEDRVVAVVFNEHNRGVPNVTIELIGLPGEVRPKRETIVVRETGLSGQISFGQLDPGKYILRLILPDSFVPLGQSEHTFNISGNQPGVKAIFHIRTGEKKPEDRSIPNLRLWIHPWPNIDEPFSNRWLRDRGYVEINLEAPDIRSAIESGDDEQIEALGVIYTAMAVSEEIFRGDPRMILVNASHIFAHSYALVRERDKGIQRKSKSRS